MNAAFVKTRLLAPLLYLVFAATTVNAQELTVLTEEDPPYSQTGKDGKPTGFGVEIVNEIQQRLGGKIAPVVIQPWTRVYKTAVEEPNVLAFSMTRTKEREDVFQWVGPIVENDWVLVAPKSARLKIKDLEDAKRLKNIGCVRGYAWTQFLTERGFTNLVSVSERKQNDKALQARLLDALVSADSSYAGEFLESGLNPDDFEIVLRFNKVQMYLAFSRHTDANVVAAWQAALDKMKKDGSFAAIMKKWLPNSKIPTTARPGNV